MPAMKGVRAISGLARRRLVEGRLVHGWWLGVCLLALLGQQALAAPYTVQVAALADQEAAMALQRRLATEGYPAYLVSVPTAQGRVFRVRIGSFVNREAAVRFAAAVRAARGTAAVPALAEGVPGGLMPLQPALFTDYPYLPDFTELRIIPWHEGRALRFQGNFEGDPFEAEYRVLTPESTSYTFSAWRAAPHPDGWVARAYSLPLWPDTFATLSNEELEAYQAERIGAVAARLGLEPAEVRAYRFYTPGAGMPYLVLAERFNPVTGERLPYPALGKPSGATMPRTGPELAWFGPSAEADVLEPSNLPVEVFDPYVLLGRDPDPTTLPGPGELNVSGADWHAVPDAGFARISLPDTGQGWRLVAGYPIWGFADFLLVYDEQDLLLYGFDRR